jgi:nucleoside-diphosphate-sugar epimerase
VLELNKVLLVGCGSLGIALGQQLLAQGVEVFGLRRDTGKLPAGIQPLAIDLNDGRQCLVLAEQQWDCVVITLTPGAFNDEAYRRAYVESLQNLLPVLQQQDRPPYVLLVSSTSVYGQQAGEWVDEDSVTEPSSFSGRRLLEAEQLLVTSGLPHSIIRCAGIYGGNRPRLIDSVLAGEGSPTQSEQWSNRIHQEDCVGFLKHLLDSYADGQLLQPLYLAVDDQPVLLHDLSNWLAEQLSVKLTSRTNRSRRGGSKRCRNRRLHDSGYRLRYPTFREGYRPWLTDLNQDH